MKPFFKPEDFIRCYIGTDEQRFAANAANEKLEREGRVVYSKLQFPFNSPLFTDWGYATINPTHIALLINIRPIEKCKHPKNKITILTEGETIIRLDEKNYPYFECECGAKLEIGGFVEKEGKR